MKIEETALIAASYRGELRFGGKHRGQWNCVQGVGALFDADIWEGTQWNKEILKTMAHTYQTIFVNFNTELIPIVSALKEAGVEQVIGIQEGSADLVARMGNDKRVELIEGLRIADRFGALQAGSIPFFRNISGKDNVIEVRIPCEDRVWYNNSIIGIDPTENRKFDIIMYVEPGRNLDYSANIVNGISKELGYVPKIAVSCLADGEAYLASYDMGELTILPHVPHYDYIRYVAQAKIGIHFDSGYVASRTPTMFFGVGIPCLGSERSEVQRMVCPELQYEIIYGAENARLDVINLLLDNNQITQIGAMCNRRLFKYYSRDVCKKIIEEQL